MKIVKHKVFAYITHKHHLLVFRHPFAPEAGIQVPAGTIEEGERPDAAVLREALEETGLTDLTLECFLGEQTRDMSDFGRDEIHHRRFYHLRCHTQPPQTWRHEEFFHSENLAQTPIVFEFFWAPLPDGLGAVHCAAVLHGLINRAPTTARAPTAPQRNEPHLHRFPVLIADHGIMLPRLLDALAFTAG